MRFIITWLIDWPARVAHHLAWLGPLVARITVGWVFAVTGWGKLHNLPRIIENFAGWGIPAPDILAPFVSGVELIGGVLLLLGLYTRLASVPLAITMIVAIKSVLWPDVESLADLLGLSEFADLAIFLWLGSAGAGKVSLDHLLQRWNGTVEYE